MCEIEVNYQIEISCSDEENQTAENFSEIMSSEIHTTILSYSEINTKTRSLNLKQRQIFDFIYNSAKSRVKFKSGTISKQSTPFHLFLLGSRGCDKLPSIIAVFHAIDKLFFYQSDGPAKPRVLLLAPIGFAAINVNRRMSR